MSWVPSGVERDRGTAWTAARPGVGPIPDQFSPGVGICELGRSQ
jgi:hypothetical protein